MAYNYAAAYGTSYGQYAAQPSSFTSQQTTASSYGHYGQSAPAYGTASSSTTTSTAVASVTSHGYGSAPAAATTTAQSYNFGYNYNYGTDSSNAYNQAATSAIQAFQQSWYNNSPSATTATANQQTASTAQTTAQQQQHQQYGQYLQQYQQLAAYQQQYANAAAAKTDTTAQQQQQHTAAWAAYNQSQRQQQQPSTQATAATNTAKTGWNAYQQQQGTTSQQTGANNQQKSTGLVYRTPMKYPNTAAQYGTTNTAQSYSTNQQQYKSPNTNTGYGSGTNQTYNQPAYSSATQSYATNQSYGTTGQQQQQQPYGSNQTIKSAPTLYNQNQAYQGGQNVGGNYNNQGYGNQPRGGYTGPNNNNNGPMGVNMQGMHQRGNRPSAPQRSPMGSGGPQYGNVGPPREGPDIPPFPRAWHLQEQGNDFQRPGGYGEQKERWGPGAGRGYNQGRGMYNNNARNPRAANRELWSPAQKSTPKQEKEKTTPVKKDEAEKIDKEKHPEIKSYLYAWLGGRHSQPIYDTRQIGERPSIMFRCELRVEKYSFVGVGKATSKKEAQTTAAWNFAEYLVEIGELKESELPNKQIAPLPEEIDEDIGDVREEKNEENTDTPIVTSNQNKGRREYDNRNRDRRGPGRGRMGGMNRRGNQNWGPQPQMPEMMGDIPPLMAVPVGPWGAPHMAPPPPRMMGPPPQPLMDFAPPFWDDGPWIRPPPMGMGMGPPPPMGPPMHMRPPPPFMRRNQQNDFWRRRDIEERMMDISRGQDWTHPEDMFISQMIRNQQEGERRQRGLRGHQMEAIPGEWERVQQQSRPVVTSDDRHVMSKHAEIYPQEGELKNLHRIVNTVEQALKLLSDKFVDEDHPKEEAKKEKATDEEEMSKEEKKDTEAAKEETEGEKSMEQDGENKEEKEETEEKEIGENKEEKGETEKKEANESKEEKGDAEKKEDSETKENREKKEEKRAKIKILKRPKRTPKQVDTRPRVLCGVNRIGPLAKGLLITKDDHVELALLCGEIPTEKLLDRILSHVEEKLCEVDEEFKLSVEKRLDNAGFIVRSSSDDESPVEVMVILTAMALKKPADKKVDNKKKEKKEEENEEQKETEEEKKEEEVAEEPDPVGMLPKRKMLDALACLRHTHWFQAKACGVQSCVVLTRILRDLQRRNELWKPISDWALEVLIFNCLTSSEEQMSPGDATRRFFEVMAGGIILPGMPGIIDPCEKAEQRDVLDCVTTQEREKITQSAQIYLRHLAFREVHKILGMEKLVPTSYRPENQPPPKSANKDQENDNKTGDGASEDKDKSGETNNQRKRRFEHNGNDSVAESPKRSLTDEEDTDTQQNLAELSISDEASEGREAALEEEGDGKEKSDDAELKDDDLNMETELTEAEEDALLEEDKMDE